VGEFVPGYEATGWLGVGAPKNTTAEIIERLNKEISKENIRLSEGSSWAVLW
jgi:tripartite-type tricarboxylate transporter receptor subunit TctC